MQLIQTVIVGSGGAATIEFTSIPATFTDLLLVVSGRTNSGFDFDRPAMRINNLTSGYSVHTLLGDGQNPYSTSESGQSFLFAVEAPYLVGGTATASTFGVAQIYFPNYRSSAAKSVSLEGVTERNGVNAFQIISAGLSTDTAPITSLLIDPGLGNFVQHSSASLYGITAGSSNGVTVA